MNTTSRTLAWILVLVTGTFAASYLMMGLAARADETQTYDFQAFGRLPVLDHGRVKPIDTLARVNLMILSGRQEYKDEKGATQPATRWLLDVMTSDARQDPTDEQPIPGESSKVKAYRIEDPALREMLELKEGKVFSFQDIYQAGGKKGLLGLEKKAQELQAVDPKNLNERDRELVELADQLRWHMRYSRYETPHKVFRIDNDEVLTLLGLQGREGYRYGFDEFLPRLANLRREAVRASAIKSKERSVYDQKSLETWHHVELYVGLAEGMAPTLHLVAPSFKGDEWKILPRARIELRKVQRNDEKAISGHVSTIAFEALLMTYASNKPAEFNKVVDRYHKLIAEVLPAQAGTASTEASFNIFAPFYRCAVLYVIVFVIACVSWLWADPLVNRLAFWLMVLTLVVHTWALILRMWIQGRPPVTNLYSSAVFIGWAAVICCIGIELRFRNNLATAVASLTGFATLLIAHYLGGSGDTLEMMQAVLDTNFWLATHVTTVTIGYSATFVAGVFGILFLWQRLVTGLMNGLRNGGPLSVGGLWTYLLASLGMTILANTLFIGILSGLWYLAHRDRVVGYLLGVVSVGLFVAGIAYSIYLTVQRARLAGVSETPLRLPRGTRVLEQFAMTEDRRKVLTWMIYGTVCFAMLFSFVGTVLGGIWADQSWGRFWGWDPKENGALLIVIMNALILHARWGGMVQERGMATLAILGNMVTMWSWFGTNQLGIGLHAYGFNNALVLLCRWFWLSQLALIGLAMLPLVNARTYAPLPVDKPAPAKGMPRLKGKAAESIQPA